MHDAGMVNYVLLSYCTFCDKQRHNTLVIGELPLSIDSIEQAGTMTTLEEAIKAAKIAVEDFDKVVMIDRSQFASRKRGRIAVITKSKDLLGGSPSGGPLEEIDSNSEANFWREKYEKLREEKSNAEEELEHQLEITTEREQKLDKYAKLLEKKVEQLVGSVSAVSSSTDIPETLRKKAAFYEIMTSMSVNVQDDGGYICTVRNTVKKSATRFKIELKEESDDARAEGSDQEVNYTPMANPAILPEYLQSEISCGAKMLPVIMGDVLQLLYEES